MDVLGNPQVRETEQNKDSIERALSSTLEMHG